MVLCTFSPPIMGIVEWGLDLDKPLGRGANATVYKEAINGEEFALKIYHGPSHIELQKLKSMVASPPNIFKKVNGHTYPIFGWPLSLVSEKATGQTIGFVMPLVDERSSKTLDFYYDFILTQKLTSPISKALSFKIEILANLCGTIADLHDRGHQFVDLKPQNLRVFEGTNIVSLIDCDGYTIKDATSGNMYRAKMVSPDYIAPEISKIDPKYEPIPKSQDEYALAVIIFQMLNRGIHPFQGIVSNPNIHANTNDDKAALGLYPYGLNSSPDISPIANSIHETFLDETRRLFDKAFGSTVRPKASEWESHLRRILTDKNIVRCEKHPNDIEHMKFRGNECPVCFKPLRKPKAVKRKKKIIDDAASKDSESAQFIGGSVSPNNVAGSDSSIMWIFFICALGLGLFLAFGGSTERIKNFLSWRPISQATAPNSQSNVSLEFCNKSSKNVSVAIGYKSDPASRVAGWYNIDPASCMTVGSYSRDQLYWYAKSDDLEWQSNQTSYAACLNLNIRVDEVARTSCRQGEVLKRFHSLVTNDTKYTMNLTVNEPSTAETRNSVYCVSGLSNQGPDNFLVVRYEPNLNSRWRQDVQLRNGDCVQVLGQSGDFYRVNARGYEGWSAKRYLSRAN